MTKGLGPFRPVPRSLMSRFPLSNRIKVDERGIEQCRIVSNVIRFGGGLAPSFGRKVLRYVCDIFGRKT